MVNTTGNEASNSAYARLWEKGPETTDTQLAVAPLPPQATDSLQSMEEPKTQLPKKTETALLNQLVQIDRQSRNCCTALLCGIVGFIPSVIACFFVGIADFLSSGFENSCELTRTKTLACWECFLPSKMQKKKALIQSYREKNFTISKNEEDRLLGLKK